MASGTPACRENVNQATASWTIGTTDFSTSSNTVTTTVAEILDVVTTWQDASPVVVTAAATSQVLTFLVTNIGNGTDSYTLAPGDDVVYAIHRENAGRKPAESVAITNPIPTHMICKTIEKTGSPTAPMFAGISTSLFPPAARGLFTFVPACSSPPSTEGDHP